MAVMERSTRPQSQALLNTAIAEALAYSDVFDYPLRLEELWRYMPQPVSLLQLRAALNGGVECVSLRDGFYCLEGREHLAAVRRERESISRRAMRRAVQYGRVLGRLPFVRMVAVTGSLAVLNSEEDGDLDYMLVTAPGRVWTARGFALLFGRLIARTGHTICPNLIVSENALKWPEHDLYTAREICQMIPIAGEETYERLRHINNWTGEFLPNAQGAPCAVEGPAYMSKGVQSIAEWSLRGDLGDRVESWEMDRKIRRLRRQAGFGLETRFDADVCQGNFLHHGAQTRQALMQRLARLQIDSPLLVSESD